MTHHRTVSSDGPLAKALRILMTVAFGLALIGCGKSADQKAEEHYNRGNQFMAQGRIADAIDELRAAVRDAEKAKSKNPSFDTTKFTTALNEAFPKAAAKAQELLAQARSRAASDPWGAKDLLDQASRLSGERYGNDAKVRADIAQVLASDDMIAIRMSQEMDALTDKFNDWLAARAYYANSSSDWAGFWMMERMERYAAVIAGMDHLKENLDKWKAKGSSTADSALTKLAEMKSFFVAWRTISMISPELSQVKSASMYLWLEKHVELRTTLRGSREINWFMLRNTWGIGYDPRVTEPGRRWSYHGTGDGNVPVGPGIDGTGPGGGPGTGPGGVTGTGPGGTTRQPSTNTNTGRGDRQPGDSTGPGGPVRRPSTNTDPFFGDLPQSGPGTGPGNTNSPPPRRGGGTGRQ